MTQQLQALLPRLHYCMRRVLASELINGYGDDVVQEAWIMTWRAMAAGLEPRWGLLYVNVRRSIRSVMGDPRYRVPWHKHEFGTVPDGVTSAPREGTALCVRRLQAVWPTLTRNQQAALLASIDGRGATAEVAAELGISLASLSHSKRQALRRLDDPTSFARSAQSQVRGGRS